jgi:D-alanyl-D-alanine carboxypeptidase
MDPKDNKKVSKTQIIMAFLIIAILGLGGYSYAMVRKNKSTNEILATKTADYENKISNLELERTSLSDALEAQIQRNDEFEDQIREISGTVGNLTKLSKIDPELLKKYSKVFFLNEHYEPPKLRNIDEKYLLNPADDQFVQTDVNYFLERMLDAAKNKDLEIKIVSGYRSFGTQASLKSNYKVTYGAGTANQFSADQGYSEHQLGTTLDFTTKTVGASMEGFQNTDEYKWLVANAYKYGFVLSYPEGNAYYVYEPWHWRFVGIKLARELNSEDMNFYDMDQREIDKYLINLFDRS